MNERRIDPVTIRLSDEVTIVLSGESRQALLAEMNLPSLRPDAQGVRRRRHVETRRRYERAGEARRAGRPPVHGARRAGRLRGTARRSVRAEKRPPIGRMTSLYRRCSFASSALTGSLPNIAPLTPLGTAGSPLRRDRSPPEVEPAALDGSGSTASATILETFPASSASSRDR